MNKQHPFAKTYQFQMDKTRDGRTLEWVKVGDVYISRVTVEPNAVLANLYYRSTNLIFFVEKGKLKMKCVQVITKEEKEQDIGPGKGIVHVPPHTAFAMKNVQSEPSILVMFSDKQLRQKEEHLQDDKEFIIYN